MIHQISQGVYHNHTYHDWCNEHLVKFGLLCDFQYGFGASRKTENFLTIIAEKIVRLLNMTVATGTIAVDI